MVVVGSATALGTLGFGCQGLMGGPDATGVAAVERRSGAAEVRSIDGVATASTGTEVLTPRARGDAASRRTRRGCAPPGGDVMDRRGTTSAAAVGPGVGRRPARAPIAAVATSRVELSTSRSSTARGVSTLSASARSVSVSSQAASRSATSWTWGVDASARQTKGEGSTVGSASRAASAVGRSARAASAARTCSSRSLASCSITGWGRCGRLARERRLPGSASASRSHKHRSQSGTLEVQRDPHRLMPKRTWHRGEVLRLTPLRHWWDGEEVA